MVLLIDFILIAMILFRCTSKQTIDVALSGGSAHFVGLRASARSVITHASNPERVVIHAFELEGDRYDIVGLNEFRQWVSAKGASFIKHTFSERDIAPYLNNHLNVKGERLKSPSNYVRYILAEKLPQTTIIMYMDTDIIAIRDVTPLFALAESSREILAAFPRDFHNIRNSSYGVLRQRGIDVAQPRPSFNAGLLFINLELWKQRDISSQAARVASINNELNLWPDFGSQPPLLILLGGDRFVKLNKSLLANNVAYEKLEEERRQHTIFLHWNGRQKPWMPCAWYWEKPSCLNWDVWNRYAH